MAPQVFVSYASADKDVADRVCKCLEQAGVSCWIAPRDIPPGVDYPAAIVEAVHSVSVLVLVLTEHATGSPHILSEVGHAFNDKKRIIPFRLTSSPLPEDLEYFLSLTQWLDVPDGCTDSNLKRLLDATQAALAGTKPTGGTVPPKRRVGWLAVLIGAVVVTLAVAAGLWFRPSKQVSKETPTPVSTSSAVAPKTWLNPADGLTYVWIPPGEFTMGCSESDNECSDEEKPAHPVNIEKGFWLGQTEVTLAAYRKFAAQHGVKAPAGADNLPATQVTRAGAKAYCAAVGGRLPTEAEWEYAARGGKPQAYYGVVPDIAWYASNSDDAPHPVGMKKPNAYGLYDMLGNVREWVLDRYYKKYYLDSPATGDKVDQPLVPNATAVTRGGSWVSEASALRVSQRFETESDAVDPRIGWRCARDHQQ